MRSIINHVPGVKDLTQLDILTYMILITTQVDDTDGNFNNNTTEYEIYHFLFLSGFSFTNIHDSQDSRERLSL